MDFLHEETGLGAIVGQERLKKVFHLFTKTFERTGRMPNLGMFGRSGMGKTALVKAWCGSLGAEVFEINGTSIGDILAVREFMLQAHEQPDKHFMLFIDEAHALKKSVQTSLLTMLEEPFCLTAEAPRDLGHIIGPDGRGYFVSKGDIIREKMPENLSVTLATTDPHRVLKTVISRLRTMELDEYSDAQLVLIAEKNLPNAPEIHLMGLARRMRSIRHMIDTLITMYSDIVDAEGKPNMQMLDDLLGIDEDGATKNDILYLRYLEANGASGVVNVASFLKKDAKEVETDVEPFLMAKGWVGRARRGRELTQLGRAKLLELKDS